MFGAQKPSELISDTPEEVEPCTGESIPTEPDDWRSAGGDPQELFELYLGIEINQLKVCREFHVKTRNPYMVQKIDRLINRYESGDRSGEMMKLIRSVSLTMVN